MEISNSDFGQIRAFATIAALGSFSRAALALGVSASALSQTIRLLEAKLGVRLLHRTTRQVSLTEAGEILFRRVRPAVEELGAALGDARQARSLPAGTVKIHSFRYPATKFIGPILKAFSAEYPDIVLDITLDDEVVDIVAKRFDVGLRIGEVIDRDMVAMRLGPDIAQIAVASPDYLAVHGVPKHPRELTLHSCIGWRWPGQERVYKWEFFEAGKWFDVNVSGPVISSAKDFGLQAAIDGVGIAFTVREMAAEAIAAGKLVPLLEDWAGPFPGYFLCYPAQRQMPPALRVFVDAVCKHARQIEHQKQ